MNKSNKRFYSKPHTSRTGVPRLYVTAYYADFSNNFGVPLDSGVMAREGGGRQGLSVG